MESTISNIQTNLEAQILQSQEEANNALRQKVEALD